LSPKPKGKHGVKIVCVETEPLVLKFQPTGESFAQNALPIPSSKTKEFIAKDEMIRKVVKYFLVTTVKEYHSEGIPMMVLTFSDLIPGCTGLRTYSY
jgi:hypothetical protein